MMLKAAHFYASEGFSIIACDGNKRSILPWKIYTQAIATPHEIESQFSHPKCKSIAVICGSVSGGLEVVDVDLKYALYDLWPLFVEAIGDDLFKKLYVVKTKSGGYHLYYRCEEVSGNQKLAMRPPTEEERKQNPNVKEVVLIETRGENGYVIAPPTEGYERVNEFSVSVISIDEREAILSAARSFNEVIKEQRTYHRITKDAANYQLTPWDDYNEKCDVVALLEKHGWKYVYEKGERVFLKRPEAGVGSSAKTSGDYHRGLNLFKVFSTSTCFEINAGYKPFAIFAILEHNGDFSAAAKRLVELGYGQSAPVGKIAGKVLRSLGSGANKEQISKILISEDGIDPDQARRIIEDVENQTGETIQEFWEVEFTKSGKKISVLRYKLMEFLFDEGFHLFFYEANSPIYRIVRQKGGFVYDASTEGMKKVVKEYILSLPDKFDGITPAELMEEVMKGANTYFGKDLTEFIDKRDIDVLKDSSREAFFTFKNGIVVVTKDSIEFKNYGEINKPVWKSQVIDFNIDIDAEFDPNLCEFLRFLSLVSLGEDAPEKTDQKDNLDYLCTLIGYLLHRYKDPSRPFAVILAEETEDEKKGGGTGKGILVKALSYMANMVRVDGKNFKVDKNFAFQRVGLDTKLVAIEDTRKNVDFEGFYSIITEGFVIERKNKDEFRIPYEDSPKVLFSTNYTISQNGNHGKRRQKIFEFTSYFGPKRTPDKVFGHRLFEDWDNDEWNRFYNLMFVCVREYLEFGVHDIAQSDRMHRKHIRLNYTPEFMEYWDDTLSLMEDYTEFSTLYGNFLSRNLLEKKEYSKKRFRAAIDECCDRFNFSLMSNKRGMQKELFIYIKR